MVEIKNILGERLMSVPILRDAVIHRELMASDYIALSWNADEGEELPVGAYIEYEGERYTLYEPYLPTMVNEGEYRYNPKFYSREEAWNKQPACVYTYGDDGKTIKSRDFDWSLVGSPEDAMHIIKQAIKNETGEEWTIAIADSLPATIDVSSQASSIVSVLSDIASQCSTEYWLDKKNNVIHLSKCEVGDPVSLEVGSNVGIPSITSNKSEYYTRYYALGSTRNITQSGGSVNGTVNKRLTLDPAVYPMGYKDVKGRIENGVFVSELEQGEIFSKVLIFDDIYPSSSLEITDVRPRMKYLLDGGKKVKVGGTDEEPVYDQYAIWYFKIKDFVFSEDLLIKGLPLSVHFKSGRLAGQEFELIYHSKAVTENTEGDVIPFDVQAGDFEIKFTESTGTIIPDIAYIIPQESDKIILFNIEMPAEYTTSAQQELLEALDKAIEEDRKDGNTYEVESNPIAFYEMGLLIDLGQRVSFKYGGHSLETRALMVERRLDNTCEQKIRVGNDIIQGSTKELRENVATLNHNVDVLSAFNDLSRSIQDSYGRTQALINESVALVLGIWTLDSEGNLVTEKKVRINNNLIVAGDALAEGQFAAAVAGTEGGGGGVTYLANLYDVALSSLVSGDILSWNGNSWVNIKQSSLVPDLSAYATKTYVTNALTPYATKDNVTSALGGYLPLSGGTIDGSLQVVSQNGEINLYNKNKGNTGWLFYNGGSEWKVTDNGWQHDYALIHSGNVGDYALRYYGTDMPSNVANNVGYGKIETGWKYYGPAVTLGIASYFFQLQKEYDTTNLVFRSYNSGTYSDWKTIAFTDSNVASASYAGSLNEYEVLDFVAQGSSSIKGWHNWGNPTGTSFATYTHGIVACSPDVNVCHFIGFGNDDATPSIRSISYGNDSGWKSVALTDSTVAAATRLVTTSGAYMIHLTDYTLYIGDSVYPTRSTDLFGKEIALRYGAGATNGLVLNQSGNVLIGTTDDNGAKLQVEGSIIAKNSFSLYESDNIYFHLSQTPWYATIQSTHIGTAYLPIAINGNGGNVGIGTYNPQATLDVAGSARVNEITIGGIRIYVENGVLKINGNVLTLGQFASAVAAN